MVMTRDTDVYVPLEERVAIARRAGADLFLSLHADSGSDPSIHGASVYTLSERGPAAVGYVLHRNECSCRTPPTATTARSARSCSTSPSAPPATARPAFAQTLIETVGDRANLLPRSQRDADYFVLLAPDVPAALLEMAS